MDKSPCWRRFLLAARQVDQFYQDQGRLKTEHALLDDNGDSRSGHAARMVPRKGGARTRRRRKANPSMVCGRIKMILARDAAKASRKSGSPRARAPR